MSTPPNGADSIVHFWHHQTTQKGSSSLADAGTHSLGSSSLSGQLPGSGVPCAALSRVLEVNV